MGIDGLDIVFRLEKEFSFSLRERGGNLMDASEQAIRKRPTNVTAGMIHERLCTLLKEHGREVPADSWDRVRHCIAGALGIPLEEIQRGDRIVQDLGAN